MSSKAKKIANNIEETLAYKKYEMYGSLFGSILVSVGKLSGITEEKLLEDFEMFKTDDGVSACKNIQEITDYIIHFYGMPDDYRDHLVLVHDKRDIYTPVVTIEEDGYILPLAPEGIHMGILQQVGNDYIEVEYIFDENKENEAKN